MGLIDHRVALLLISLQNYLFEPIFSAEPLKRRRSGITWGLTSTVACVKSQIDTA